MARTARLLGGARTRGYGYAIPIWSAPDQRTRTNRSLPAGSVVLVHEDRPDGWSRIRWPVRALRGGQVIGGWIPSAYTTDAPGRVRVGQASRIGQAPRDGVVIAASPRIAPYAGVLPPYAIDPSGPTSWRTAMLVTGSALVSVGDTVRILDEVAVRTTPGLDNPEGSRPQTMHFAPQPGGPAGGPLWYRIAFPWARGPGGRGEGWIEGRLVRATPRATVSDVLVPAPSPGASPFKPKPRVPVKENAKRLVPVAERRARAAALEEQRQAEAAAAAAAPQGGSFVTMRCASPYANWCSIYAENDISKVYSVDRGVAIAVRAKAPDGRSAPGYVHATLPNGFRGWMAIAELRA